MSNRTKLETFAKQAARVLWTGAALRVHEGRAAELITKGLAEAFNVEAVREAHADDRRSEQAEHLRAAIKERNELRALVRKLQGGGGYGG